MQTRTRRQRQVLDFITNFIEKNGHAPSYQTVARYLGVASKTGVGKHIRALEEQGLLHRLRVGKSFRLMLGRQKNGPLAEDSIEWLGTPHPDGYNGFEQTPFCIPEFLLGGRSPDSMLAFRMPDDGLYEKHIREGDIVLVEKRNYGRDGDCLAVTVNGDEPILRNYYRAGADIELRSTNGSFPDIRLSGDEVEIHGIYRGLLRPVN